MKDLANVTWLDDQRVLIPVTGEGDEPSEELETPEVGGVSTETPDTSKEDERLAQLKSDYDKIQKDLNKQKSVFQQREHELQTEAQQREAALKQEIDKLRRSTLTEKDADRYEKEVALEQLAELREELEKERVARTEREQFAYWKDRFTDEYGVPRDQLVLDQGVQGLVQSGMEAIKEMIAEAKKASDKPAKKAQSKQEPPETPKPAKGDASQKKMTLKEAADKYAGGDIDALFRQWETGQLKRDLFNDIAEVYEQKD